MISECFCTLSDLVAIPLCIAGQVELCMRLCLRYLADSFAQRLRSCGCCPIS